MTAQTAKALVLNWTAARNRVLAYAEDLRIQVKAGQLRDDLVSDMLEAFIGRMTSIEPEWADDLLQIAMNDGGTFTGGSNRPPANRASASRRP